MKDIGSWLRAFFLSFEFLVLVMGIVSVMLWRHSIAHWLTYFQVSTKLVEWAVLAPIGIFGLVLRVCRDLRVPKNCDLGEYHRWPEYGRLRIIAHVAVAHGLIFCAIAILAWLIKGPESVRAILMATAICGAGAGYLSVYYAEITLAEILATRKGSKSA